MSTLTMEYTGTLTIVTCAHEGCVTYAIPESLYKARRRDHVMIYCPFGHAWHYTGESDLEREKRLAVAARQDADRAWAAYSASQDQLRASQRQKAALKGQLTKARNKIAAGTCPVPDCGQHFANVREHMRHRHPEWHLTDPETGKAAVL